MSDGSKPHGHAKRVRGVSELGSFRSHVDHLDLMWCPPSFHSQTRAPTTMLLLRRTRVFGYQDPGWGSLVCSLLISTVTQASAAAQRRSPSADESDEMYRSSSASRMLVMTFLIDVSPGFSILRIVPKRNFGEPGLKLFVDLTMPIQILHL